MKKIMNILSFPFIFILLQIIFIICYENFNFKIITFIILFINLIFFILSIIFKQKKILIVNILIFTFLILFILRINYLVKEYNIACFEISISEKIIGYINSYPEIKNNKTIFRLKVLGIKNNFISDYKKIKPFDILIKINENSNIYHKGDKILINKKISLPQEKIGNFNYKKYLYYHNIYGIIQLKSNDIKIINENITPFFYDILKGNLWVFREQIISTIKSKMNNIASSFILSIIFGERGELDKETYENFQNSGLLHLIAISGLHIGFIALLVLKFFRLFLSKAKSYVFCIIVLFIYLNLIVQSASSDRAFLMFAITIFLFESGLTSTGISILSFSGMILLFINPYYIYDIGFQLSFLATFGILLFSKNIEEKIPIFLPKKIKSLISVTLSAFISIFFLQWTLFQKIQFFSLLSSIIIVPIFEILFIVILFSIFLLYFTNSIFIGFLIEKIILLFLKSVEIASIVPAVKLPHISPFLSFIVILILIICYIVILKLLNLYKSLKI